MKLTVPRAIRNRCWALAFAWYENRYQQKSLDAAEAYADRTWPRFLGKVYVEDNPP